MAHSINPNRLAGKVALVTGSGSGLGASCASRFAAEGARVIVSDVKQDVGQLLAERLGDAARFVTLDVRRVEDWRAAIDLAEKTWGRLDILVNNAAVVLPAEPVQRTSDDEFDVLIDVNLRGAYLGCRLAYQPLKASRGCVLNISSMAGVTGQRDHAIYSATKGAINALTRSTATDWGPDGIRVNALCPTAVRTDALQQWMREQPNRDEIDDYLRRIHALGYYPEADDVAAVAAFLCSDEAAFVTGCIMPVSGGSECGYKL
jgi:NAD(P)-dependent dehydrogenase (short-subunit alcohol dehydrogenase family)